MIIQSKQQLILIKFLTILFLLMLVIGHAKAETLCERVQERYPATGYWHRDCGPQPGKAFKAELKKDCRQTIRQIIARPGASWNSEWGWAPENQCHSYWPKTQADFIDLYRESDS